MDDYYYKQAKKRVQAKKRFYNHLKSYIIINTVFSLVVLTQGDPFGWLPITLFWGIGLAFHYMKVFGIPGTNILTQEWEEEQMQKEIEHLKQKEGQETETSNYALPKPGKEEELKLKEIQKSYDERDLV